MVPQRHLCLLDSFRELRVDFFPFVRQQSVELVPSAALLRLDTLRVLRRNEMQNAVSIVERRLERLLCDFG